MDCSCHLRNVQDVLTDGTTPYERRFGEPFKNPIIPFGSMIKYHPISAKDLTSTDWQESFTRDVSCMCIDRG